MKLYLTGENTDNFSALIKNKLLLKLKTDYSNYKILDTSKEEKVLETHSKEDIIEENKKIIESIKECDSFVFSLYSKNIDDYIKLGIALKMGKSIWVYNYLDNSIIGINLKNLSILDITSDIVFPLMDMSFIVRVGYNYDSKFNIYYILGNGMYDTGMLFHKFGKIKKVGLYYTLCKDNEFDACINSHVRLPRGEKIDVDSILVPLAKRIDMSFILEDKNIISKYKRNKIMAVSSDVNDYLDIDNKIISTAQKEKKEKTE